MKGGEKDRGRRVGRDQVEKPRRCAVAAHHRGREGRLDAVPIDPSAGCPGSRGAGPTGPGWPPMWHPASAVRLAVAIAAAPAAVAGRLPSLPPSPLKLMDSVAS